MKKTANIIFIILMILLLFLVAYFLVIKYAQRQKESIFANTLLRYEFQYKNPWRISNVLSKKNSEVSYTSHIMSEMGCSESFNLSENEESQEEFIKRDEECMKNNPKYNEYMDQVGNFLNNWKIENSDVIIFTNWNKEEENSFLSQVSKGEKSLVDIIFDKDISSRVISVYPSFGDMSFTEEENSTTEKKGQKIVFEKKILNLSDNKKAYIFNNNGSLLASIPHPVKTGTFIGETTELIFRAQLDDNMSNEKAFYDMLYSLKFK